VKKPTKAKLEEIRNKLLKKYDNAKTELEYRSDYELLTAIILSAQCTDKRVNIVTKELFAKYPCVIKMADADLNELKKTINSCSFFNNKAENLIKMAKAVVTNHGCKIPSSEDELKALAGVGQKTAHVFLIEFHGKNFMAVDTHVFRTSHRLGLSDAKSASKTEEDLVRLFKTDLSSLHQAFVLFGRYICKSKKPLCESDCFLGEYCVSKEPFKPA
jgi:endonuclease III